MELTMDATEIGRRLDLLNAQIGFLVERQRKQEELFDALSPVLREVMATATGKLDQMEQKGWFKFGGALTEVATRILDHYTAEDVHALGGAIVSILDTARALTQPEVLAIVGEAGEVLQHADQAQPIGLLGMIRASRHEEVQKGMAVLMEVLRHVGRAAQAVAAEERPPLDRKARLAETLGPRRKKVLGIERTPPRVLAKARDGNGAAAATRPAACATPSTRPAVGATVIDGVAFTAEGHLVEPSQWTRQLAENIATLEGITLTPQHWKLIESARADFEQNHAAANIRRLTQVAGVNTKDIYALFPKAPGRTIARIAGTPKPVGCI
jgi:dissimilatory sulfite reductase related protein